MSDPEKSELPVDRRYKSVDDHKTYEVHFRIPKEDYSLLRSRATLNNLKLSEYIRRCVLNDQYTKLNTDFELFMELQRIHTVLVKTGNYMVKVRNVMDGKDYTLADKLKKGIEHEAKVIDKLSEILNKYMTMTR